MGMTQPPSDSSKDSVHDGDKIRVMLVDDSAVIRGLIARSLEAEKDMEVVSSLHNGEAAVNSIAKAKPDVVILDIEMPIMDGITALPLLRKAYADAQIIICSTLSSKGAEVTMKAITLGATDCIVKPTSTSEMGGANDFRKNLVNMIRGMVRTRRAIVPPPNMASDNASEARTASSANGSIQLMNKLLLYQGRPRVLAIASSTGGPNALFSVLKHLKDLPIPIVITQHMPKTFTRILAQHIEQNCGVPCHEAEQGMLIENGHAYVAQGAYHMELTQLENHNIAINITDSPPEKYCKPSAEPMFRSLQKLYGHKVLIGVLTGMGNDGVDGAQAIVKDGGYLIAQDEATSVVWGMPGAVAAAGICAEILPLDQIGPRLREKALGIG
jgi:two-component system chemotaxis response regulator CheB